MLMMELLVQDFGYCERSEREGISCAGRAALEQDLRVQHDSSVDRSGTQVLQLRRVGEAAAEVFACQVAGCHVGTALAAKLCADGSISVRLVFEAAEGSRCA
jgi:hypothetical protein